MLFSSNAYASDGGSVVVTRTVSGATDPACFMPGDYFTVALDYTVTGKHYQVKINETLPDGFLLMDSTADHRYDVLNNTVEWNLTDPIFGVVSGQLQYHVCIPNTTSAGHYNITGTAAWCDSFSNVSQCKFCGTTETPLTTVLVDVAEYNGPCSWIRDISEEIGDGDEHLENGEWASFNFSICDRDGINAFETYVNGVRCMNITDIEVYEHEGGLMIFGRGHARVTIQQDCLNMFCIWANDSSGYESLGSFGTYVPYHDNKAWTTSDWMGMKSNFAAMGFTSLPEDGNWMYLCGGDEMDFPATDIHFSGVPVLKMSMIINNSSMPIMKELNRANISVISTYGEDEIIVPYETYPVYCEYGDKNNVCGTFRGSPELAHQCFHVVLVNQTYVTSIINMSSAQAMIQSFGSISMTDLMNTQIASLEMKCDANGDFVLDGTNMPALNCMKQGLYQLIVFDRGIPNTPCVISTAEIVVAKNEVLTELVDIAPQPGDSLTYFCSLEGPTAPYGTNYTYTVMMAPLDEWKATVVNYCDNTWNGTSTVFNGFSMPQVYNISSGGTTDTTVFYMTGLSGSYVLDGPNMRNTTFMKDMLMNEINNSSCAMGFISSDATSAVEVVVQTRSTMPEGWYVVMTGVLDRNYVSMTAMTQQYVYLGDYEFDLELCCGWNMISEPCVLYETDPEAFFAPISGMLEIVWAYDAETCCWLYYVPGDVNSTLTCIDEKMGLWVYVTGECVLPCIGCPPGYEEIPVYCGWNLVGYPCLYPKDCDTAYGSICDKLTIVWSYDCDTQCWLFYVPGGAGNTLCEVDPGCGYWLRMTEDAIYCV